MVGTVLSKRYELLEQVGQGGMAVTYRGRDLLLGRTVAVKVLRPQFSSDPEFVHRFRNEAQAAASLSHENIAAVYDTGCDGSNHYIVIEFVRGEDLRHRLQEQGPLPPREAAAIASAVARALAAAHEKRIVHRDIKPHNILLTTGDAAGAVKVTDFGVAKALSESGDTDTGVIIGSVHYFSPEQARGEQVSPQSDLYSLGVVLFEMLTGRKPFEGQQPVAVAHQHIYNQPPLVRSLAPHVPPNLESVVSGLLQKNPAARYPSAQALAKDLDDYPAGALHLPPKPLSRRRSPWRSLGYAAALVALAAAVVAGGFMITGRRGDMMDTPHLYDLDAESARRAVETQGLRYFEGGQEASDLDKGRVSRQQPEGGMLVKRGSGIRVWLSSGESLVQVPDVSQMSQRAAQRELEGAGLRVAQTAEESSGSVPVGYVVATRPPRGNRVEPASAVVVVVSTGPKPHPLEPELDPFAPHPPPEKPGAVEELLRFAVPRNEKGADVAVRIEVEDAEGTRTIYDATHPPGAQLPPVKIERYGAAVVRIYLDDVLSSTIEYPKKTPAPKGAEGTGAEGNTRP